MDFATLMQAIEDITGHRWLPLAVLVIGYLTMLTSDTSRFPVNVPDRWKPVVVVVLGQAYSVVQAASAGEEWRRAVWEGLVAAFGAMGLFDLVVKAMFQGKLPRWLGWLALVDPKLEWAKRSVGLTQNVFGKAKPSVPPPAS